MIKLMLNNWQERTSGDTKLVQQFPQNNKEPLCHLKELQMKIFGFSPRETGAKTLTLAMTLWLSFGLVCDAHF